MTAPGTSVRAAPRIALVTCAALRDLDPDDQLLLEPLRALGVEAVPAVWDDASIDWSAFALVVVRSTWDYTARRDDFLAWAGSVPRLVNPATVIAWNTHKTYLNEVASAGVPVVPTTWLTPADIVVLPVVGRHVVKPAIGAGSLEAAAYNMHVEHERRVALDHAARLLATGQTVMVQPYIEAIETGGEKALIFVGEEFSHAVTKGPMLAEELPLAAGGLYRSETITAAEVTEAELAVARLALSYVPGRSDRLAYARVDLVPGPSGSPVLIELELTEPSLFLGYAPGSAHRFARILATFAEKTFAEK